MVALMFSPTVRSFLQAICPSFMFYISTYPYIIFICLSNIIVKGLTTLFSSSNMSFFYVLHIYLSIYHFICLSNIIVKAFTEPFSLHQYALSLPKSIYLIYLYILYMFSFMLQHLFIILFIYLTF